ncbi:UNVERIFIED_CONTAM: hypothetical protein FKN15_038822 [Acipenser sinensis]
MLLEETIVTFQRLIDQVMWTNVPELALFLTRTNHLCTPLLDKIASVTLGHIDKIHYSATYATLLPFAVLDYDPPQGDEFFETCIQRFKPHLSSFDPHLLVLLAYSLAVADCFPEELIRTIFNVDFLSKLDAQLETLPDALNMRIRLQLIELNRAVCLECLEFQVPWFHDRFCQQLQRKDFECVLDKNKTPLPYVEQSPLLISEGRKVQWGTDTQLKERRELPPGAERVAVEFLDSKSFCKNSHHFKGEAMMRKRHLEILGYHVVQVCVCVIIYIYVYTGSKQKNGNTNVKSLNRALGHYGIPLCGVLAPQVEICSLLICSCSLHIC